MWRMHLFRSWEEQIVTYWRGFVSRFVKSLLSAFNCFKRCSVYIFFFIFSQLVLALLVVVCLRRCCCGRFSWRYGYMARQAIFIVCTNEFLFRSSFCSLATLYECAAYFWMSCVRLCCCTVLLFCCVRAY